jgi:uncharacterized protein (DUF2252 family)
MAGRISTALRLRLLSFVDTSPMESPARMMAGPELANEPRHAPPASLHGAARASYVRRALLDYHQGLIADNPTGAKDKFEKMTESPFAFFRGTADLFYRDLQGTDANLPTVIANGDVHPGNFGAIPGGDGKLFFSLDDFDEAHSAPFTWDLRRGATGLELISRERGLDDAAREAVRTAFLDGYFSAMKRFAENGSERTQRITVDRAPEPVKSLLIESADKKRKKALEKLVDLTTSKFKTTDELAPIGARAADFQEAIDRFLGTRGPFAPKSARHFVVKDVAIKSGSGLGSIGLWRYYVLIEGPSKKPEDDIVLELKQERPSALAPYVAASPLRFRSEGARVAAAEQLQLFHGDRYYGETTLDGRSYIVREKSAHKIKVELDELDPDALKAYAATMGRVVAQAHARADRDAGLGRKQVESRILKSTAIDRLSAEISAFGVSAADRTQKDHAAFKELMATSPVP